MKRVIIPLVFVCLTLFGCPDNGKFPELTVFDSTMVTEENYSKGYIGIEYQINIIGRGIDDGDFITTIDWGDDSAKTTINPCQSNFSIYSTHTWSAAGDYTLIVTITDINSQLDTIKHFNRNINIAENASPLISSFTGEINCYPGLQYVYSLTASDLNATDMLTYWIDWDDGVSYNGLFDMINGTMEFSKIWEHPGNYTVNISITDEIVTTASKLTVTVPPNVTMGFETASLDPDLWTTTNSGIGPSAAVKHSGTSSLYIPEDLGQTMMFAANMDIRPLKLKSFTVFMYDDAVAKGDEISCVLLFANYAFELIGIGICDANGNKYAVLNGITDTIVDTGIVRTSGWLKITVTFDTSNSLTIVINDGTFTTTITDILGGIGYLGLASGYNGSIGVIPISGHPHDTYFDDLTFNF